MTETLVTESKATPQRSLEQLLAPLEIIAGNSSRLAGNHSATFETAAGYHELPRYLFTGPPGGSDPIRIGLFAGIHGDEPEGAYTAVEFLRLLDRQPELASGYQIFVYPVCNPTGFENQTHGSRDGRNLNREFWRESPNPEVKLLQSELLAHCFHGIISLHTDETSPGFYGFATGSTITKHLLEPALQAAEYFLPRNTRRTIDGFQARKGIILGIHDGCLSAPPHVFPTPFHIILDAPQSAPEYLKHAAYISALRAILARYREFVAYAANL